MDVFKSKRYDKVFLFFIVLSIKTLNTHAMEGQSEAVKIISETYIKEQLKYRVSDYLNKNPEILGSANPEIGTESAKFLGKLLTAYNLINAKGDKERGVSAFYFIYSPEPTTAVILLCAQIVDMMISLSHNRDLAKIYENVASLNRQTFNIYTQIYNVKTDRQVRIINKITANLMEISDKVKSFFSSKTFEYINSNLLTTHPDDEVLTAEFEIFMSLTNNLNELRVQKMFFDVMVDDNFKSHFYKSFGVDLESQINEFLRLGESLTQIEGLIRNALMEYNGVKWRQRLLEDVHNSREKIKSYYDCLEDVNASLRGARGTEAISLRKLMREKCKKDKEMSI